MSEITNLQLPFEDKSLSLSPGEWYDLIRDDDYRPELIIDETGNGIPKQVIEMIKKEVFNQIKSSAKEKGVRLVLKENSSCMECGMMYESCMCEDETIEEFNALGTGAVAGYQTKMTTPKNMKKHMKKMLPSGYKYR